MYQENPAGRTNLSRSNGRNNNDRPHKIIVQFCVRTSIKNRCGRADFILISLFFFISFIQKSTKTAHPKDLYSHSVVFTIIADPWNQYLHIFSHVTLAGVYLYRFLSQNYSNKNPRDRNKYTNKRNTEIKILFPKSKILMRAGTQN